MKGFILFLIATVTVPWFNILGMVYSLFHYTFTRTWKFASKDFESIALSKDQLSNVVMMNFFNTVMIDTARPLKRIEGIKTETLIEFANFGNPDVTISAVFGYNKHAKRLTRFGRFWSRFLNKVDSYHVEDALKSELLNHQIKFLNFSE